MHRFSCPGCGQAVTALAAVDIVTCSRCQRLISLGEDSPPTSPGSGAGLWVFLAVTSFVVGLLLLFSASASEVLFGLGFVLLVLLTPIAILFAFGRDVRARAPEQAALWMILLLLFGPLGMLAWLAARPPLRAAR